MNKEEKPLNILVSETSLFGLVTFVGYSSYVCYQYSFLHYFGIPSYFLEFNLMNLLFTIIGLLVYLFVLYIPLSAVLIFLKRKQKIRSLKGFLYLVLYYFPFILISIGSYDPSKSKIYNILLAFVAFVFYTTILIFLKKDIKKENYVGKVNFRVLDALAGKLGKRFVVVMLLGFVFITTSFTLGSTIARQQEEYLVINTEKPAVIIKPYLNGVLAISFDKDRRVFGTEIHIHNISDINTQGVKITREHVGPLTNGGPYIEDNIYVTFFRRLFRYLNFIE